MPSPVIGKTLTMHTMPEQLPAGPGFKAQIREIICVHTISACMDR